MTNRYQHILVTISCCLTCAAMPLPSVAALLTEPAERLLLRAESEPRHREPIATDFWRNHLLVANECGTISVINPITAEVRDEWQVADYLADLECTEDRIWVTNPAANQVLALPAAFLTTTSETGNNKATILTLTGYPEFLAASADGSRLAVSCRWARQICVLQTGTETTNSARIDTSGNQQIGNPKRIALAFCPGRMTWLNDQELLVADMFGSRIARVNIKSGSITGETVIGGHNIGDLLPTDDGEWVRVTHQSLDAGTPTTYERVFWGVLMQNGLQRIAQSRFDNAENDSTDDTQSDSYEGTTSYQTATRYPLGTPSDGAGDPGRMIGLPETGLAVLLTGSHQVAVRTAEHLPFTNISVSLRPVDGARSPTTGLLYVACQYSDEICVIDPTEARVTRTISLGEQPEESLTRRGERLFYDARLSLDGWLSCHSCHTNGHSNGQMSDTFGDEYEGSPKRVPSLLGTAGTSPWAWNGSKPSLMDQIHSSLILSMQSQEPVETADQAIAAYLKTLTPPPSVESSRSGVQDAPAEISRRIRRGRKAFEAAGCADCHAGSQLTSAGLFDVGLTDDRGQTLFNPPSLRGVSQRQPLFHDSSAATLEEVLKSGHPTPNEPPLPKPVRRRILNYLNSL